jgi:hypothetical protein
LFIVRRRLTLVAVLSCAGSVPEDLNGAGASELHISREVYHVLVTVYAKCIDGQDESARRRIEAALNMSDDLADQ